MAKKTFTSQSSRKNLELLMVKYNLSAKDVFLAQLIADGMPAGDAFVSLFGLGIAGKDTACTNYINSKPTLVSLIGQLNKSTTQMVKDVKFDLRTKEGVIEALKAEYAAAVDAKQRADILNKIADIQQLKKEEDKESLNLIHYYITLRCEVCPVYPKLKKMMDEAREDAEKELVAPIANIPANEEDED